LVKITKGDLPLLGSIPKTPILAASGAVSRHFKNGIAEIWREGWAWSSLLHDKFCKNRLRGYTPLGEIYTKNYQFWRF